MTLLGHVELLEEKLSYFYDVMKPFPECLYQYIEDCKVYAVPPLTYFTTVLLLTFVMHSIRVFLNKHVFQKMCFDFSIMPKNVTKVQDSLWKVVYYVHFWLYCYYVVSKNEIVKKNLFISDVIPTDVYTLYCISGTFYLYSIYTTFFLDYWRSDSGLLIIHHLVTLNLLIISLNIKAVYIGAWVLYTVEINDIFLELAKSFKYFSQGDNPFKSTFDKLATASFFGFVALWLYMRIYKFYTDGLIRILRAVPVVFNPNTPMSLTAFVYLVSLFLMFLYWTTIMIKILVNTLLGGKDELKDVREDMDT